MSSLIEFREVCKYYQMGDTTVKAADRIAIIEGVPRLTGCAVTASDLRAGAALVIAGLMAEGVTDIYNVQYIDRGYEHLEDKLRSLGAKIERLTVD